MYRPHKSLVEVSHSTVRINLGIITPYQYVFIELQQAHGILTVIFAAVWYIDRQRNLNHRSFN